MVKRKAHKCEYLNKRLITSGMFKGSGPPEAGLDIPGLDWLANLILMVLYFPEQWSVVVSVSSESGDFVLHFLVIACDVPHL